MLAALRPVCERAPLDVLWHSDGAWSVDGAPTAVGAVLDTLRRTDVCLLALHGGAGEDGTVQGLLESAGIAYTGSGVRASAIAMDKWFTRTVLAAAGFRIAPGRLVHRGEFQRDRVALADRVTAALGAGALFVKPRSGGSSLATFKVEGGGALAVGGGLADALARAFEACEQVLVEAAVLGIETTCAVLGNTDPSAPRQGLRALPVVEIAPRGDRFFDHDQKYDPAGAEEFCPPRHLSPAVEERIAALALLAHAELGCAGVSRVDFIVPRAGDVFGEPVMLEVNTLPGMTARSLVPLSARAAGLGFADLLRELCRLGAARRGAR